MVSLHAEGTTYLVSPVATLRSFLGSSWMRLLMSSSFFTSYSSMLVSTWPYAQPHHEPHRSVSG